MPCHPHTQPRRSSRRNADSSTRGRRGVRSKPGSRFCGRSHTSYTPTEVANIDISRRYIVYSHKRWKHRHGALLDMWARHLSMYLQGEVTRVQTAASVAESCGGKKELCRQTTTNGPTRSLKHLQISLSRSPPSQREKRAVLLRHPTQHNTNRKVLCGKKAWRGQKAKKSQ